MPTYQEIQIQIKKLQEQIKKLQDEADEIREKEVAAAVADFKEKIAGYGLNAQDVCLSDNALDKTKAKAKDRSADKYKGPDGKSWSGRGRQPEWLRLALAEGKKLEDFLSEQSK